MKRLAIVLWIVATVVPARAADTVTIGYVDMRKVMNDSEAGQRVKAEVEKTVKQRQAALAKEQERLKAMQQAYEKDKLVLSEARQLEKQREFRRELETFERSAEEAQREIEQKKAAFAKQAIPEIRAIIRALARQERLTLVFDKYETPALYAADGPDLTDTVLQRYNASQR